MAYALDKDIDEHKERISSHFEISKPRYVGTNDAETGITVIKNTSHNCCFKLLSIVSLFVSLVCVGIAIYCLIRLNQYQNVIQDAKEIIQSPLSNNTNTTASPVNSDTVRPTHSPLNVSVAPTPSSFSAPNVEDSNSYKIYVGDYKISAQKKSHGNWLLCDGAFLDPRNYTELFDVISYSFGDQTSETEYVLSGNKYTLLRRFAIPNAKERVIGINGHKYSYGDKVGGSMSLSIDNIPRHSHLMKHSSGHGSTSYSGSSYSYVYSWKTTSYAFNTSSVGSGSSFELYQPTIFVGNLFIYAGDK